jgi:hypothetical protein
VRVATFNIISINKRLDNLLAWLATAEPDMVRLQEHVREGCDIFFQSRPSTKKEQAGRRIFALKHKNTKQAW